MVLRPGRGGSISLEMVDLFARYGSSKGERIDESTRRAAFDGRIAAALDESLANPSRLHGWRVQALFEAMVIGLGTVRLIKQEDIGTFFFDDVEGGIQPPDFRIVTADGEHLLVEVKGVAPKEGVKSRKLRRKDVEQLRRYADMTGARLLFAHYWSSANQWSLVDADHLAADGAHFILSIETAMMTNEMSVVGDAWITTTPPLTLTLIATPDTGTSTVDAKGAEHVDLKIAAVEYRAAGRVVEDPVGRRIAHFLMLYGGMWEEDYTPIKDDGGRVSAVVFSYTPPEPADDDYSGPPIIPVVGQLSAMYSTLYNDEALNPDNSVSTLHHDPDPGMLRDLIPAGYWDRTTESALRLGRLHLVPNRGEGATLTGEGAAVIASVGEG